MILFQIIQKLNFISTIIDHISETNKFMIFYQLPNLFLGHKLFLEKSVIYLFNYSITTLFKVEFLLEKLNKRFQWLREVETKGFWGGQIGLEERRYLDIQVTFEDKLKVRDLSLYTSDNFTLFDFIESIRLIPAFAKFALVKGQAAWNALELDFITDILNILGYPNQLLSDELLQRIVLHSSRQYFLVMGRKVSSRSISCKYL